MALVRTAANLDEWLAAFNAVERKKIFEFSGRHFGIYAVDSASQIAWMAAHGYRMPDDVLGAEKFSNADLRELANEGNEKAGLLRERDLDEMAGKMRRFRQSHPGGGNFWEPDPDGPRLRQ